MPLTENPLFDYTEDVECVPLNDLTISKKMFVLFFSKENLNRHPLKIKMLTQTVFKETLIGIGDVLR